MRTVTPFTTTVSAVRLPAGSNRRNRSACSRSHSPRACHAVRRRWAVRPEHPNSVGTSSQRHPVASRLLRQVVGDDVVGHLRHASGSHDPDLRILGRAGTPRCGIRSEVLSEPRTDYRRRRRVDAMASTHAPARGCRPESPRAVSPTPLAPRPTRGRARPDRAMHRFLQRVGANRSVSRKKPNGFESLSLRFPREGSLGGATGSAMIGGGDHLAGGCVLADRVGVALGRDAPDLVAAFRQAFGG